MTIHSTALSRLTAKTTKITTGRQAVMQAAQSGHVRMVGSPTIAVSAGGYVEDAAIAAWAHNPSGATLDVAIDWIVKGPTYEHVIQKNDPIAPGSSAYLSVSGSRWILQEDEELEVRLTSGAEVVVHTSVAEYPARVLQTARTALTETLQTVIPSPPTGKMNVPVKVPSPGAGLDSGNNIAGGASGGVVKYELNLNGNKIVGPDVTVAASGVGHFEGVIPPILKYGDNVQARLSGSGTESGFAYTSWLSVPVSP